MKSSLIDDPKFLGFNSHELLLSLIDEDFDLFCYLEDDLIIHDPLFFHKIMDFNRLMGDECLLLPHRFEFSNYPHPVDRLFIDGPIDDDELKDLYPQMVQFVLFILEDIRSHSHHHKTLIQAASFLQDRSLNIGQGNLFGWIWMQACLTIRKCSHTRYIQGLYPFKPCLSHASWFEI